LLALLLRPCVAASVLMLLLAGRAAADSRIAVEPREVIVRFSAAADGADRLSVRRSVDAGLERSLGGIRTQLLELPAGVNVEQVAAWLERQPEVRHAEPNLRRSLNATVNDPLLGYLWGLRNTGQSIQGRSGTPGADMRALPAWDLSVGASWPPIAVIDSGVDVQHPDLAGRGWRNPGEVAGNGLDDDGNGYADDLQGWDWVGDDAEPTDANGHGTHVAGTIAATGNDGTGIVGVAPTASVMPLRVLDADGTGTLADLLEAYDYAARNGARVINLSLGGGTASRIERETIAAADGVLFIAAAGNGGDDGVGDDNDRAGQYPCAYDLDNVLCVAAVDATDALAPFSNYGLASVDLAAPGVSILSDILTRAGQAQYGFASGTSMATPHVTGAAALVGAAVPHATPDVLRRAILGSVAPLQSLAGRVATGGRLDARAALELAQRDAGFAPGQGPSSPTPNNPQPPPAGPAPVPGAPPPAPPPGAPPSGPTLHDNDPPLASLTAPRMQPITRLRAHGLRIRAGCSEPCRLSGQLRLRRRTVARGRSALRSAGRRTMRLRQARASQRIRIGGRATLVVRYSDAAGNIRVLRARVRLSR
jgi:thermitase